MLKTTSPTIPTTSGARLCTVITTEGRYPAPSWRGYLLPLCSLAHALDRSSRRRRHRNRPKLVSPFRRCYCGATVKTEKRTTRAEPSDLPHASQAAAIEDLTQVSSQTHITPLLSLSLSLSFLCSTQGVPNLHAESPMPPSLVAPASCKQVGSVAPANPGEAELPLPPAARSSQPKLDNLRLFSAETQQPISALDVPLDSIRSSSALFPGFLLTNSRRSLSPTP